MTFDLPLWLFIAGTVGIGTVQSVEHPQPAPLCAALGLALVVSVCARDHGWSRSVAMLGFVFCAVPAGDWLVSLPWYATNDYAYQVRPAPVLIALACAGTLFRNSFSRDQAAGQTWTRLVTTIAVVIAIALSAGYATLSRYYNLDNAVLRDALRHLAVIVGAHAIFPATTESRAHAYAFTFLPMAGVAITFLAACGGI